MSITKVNADVLDLTDGYAFTGAVSGAGKVVQMVNVQDSTVGTVTTIIPIDTSIPQNDEGGEIMTLAITPTSSSNKLYIDVSLNGIDAGSSEDITGLLFQDTTANSLAACNQYMASTTGTGLAMRHYMTAGTTSATTFKIRLGPGTSGTITYNGSAGGTDTYGTAMHSSMTIWEISA